MILAVPLLLGAVGTTIWAIEYVWSRQGDKK